MECSICQEKISRFPCRNRKLLCGHNYHNKCINKWLAKENNCPLCRAIAIPCYIFKDRVSRSHCGVPIMTDIIFAETRSRLSCGEVIDKILVKIEIFMYYNSTCKLIFRTYAKFGILLNRIIYSKTPLRKKE